MKFDAALLAGGRSSRMRQDKALLDWHGQPLWLVQMHKLASLQPEHLFIASRSEQALQTSFDHDLPSSDAPITFVNDPPDEDCGPIGAIARCLRLASSHLLVLAVDMPVMTAAFLREHLLTKASEAKSLVCRGTHGFEALAAIYAPSALPFFEAASISGRFALQPLLAELVGAGLCDVVELHGGEEPFFANANTPEEAERLLHFQI